MKQKIKIYIFILIFIYLVFLVPNKSFALTNNGGYTIESYDVNMIVNENNTFDITETISVIFTGNNNHGIYRKIPTRNTLIRDDGSRSSNIAKISNITANDKFTISNQNGYKIIKLGDKHETVSGNQTYIIKYNYNIGRDPLKNKDELYFNLLGNDRDEEVKNVTFTVEMPKTFDASTIGFTRGYRRYSEIADVNYTVSGHTIKGHLNNSLESNEALTIRLTLPEGYFVGASYNIDYLRLFKILICLIMVIISYTLWNKYGKDNMIFKTAEFYPPYGLNSLDVGFFYKGYTEKKDVLSLLIYLANKGYLKIEEYEKGDLTTDNFKIIKLKDYDGDNEYEKMFLEGLFNSKKQEVTYNDLYNKFYLTLNEITSKVDNRENEELIFEKISLEKRFIILVMIFIVFFIMTGLSIFKVGFGGPFVMCLSFLTGSLLFVYIEPKAENILLACISWGIVGLYYMMVNNSNELFNISLLAELIVEEFSLIMLIVFLAIIRRRTQYGTKILSKIKGFKNFLETVEKPRLEQLVMDDPEYFYNILPYTYVLDISDKWIKKFENITLKAPDWYYGYSSLNTHNFSNIINSTYSSISYSMSSQVSTSSSGGSSSSGGGISGGGSGGGGMGSW